MFQVLTGRTYTFNFDFLEDTGDRTSVETPVADFFTPERNRYQTALSLTSVTALTGRYKTDLFLEAGLTVGNWFALGCGITQGMTIFSQNVPFEIIDLGVEPFWVGLDELRVHLGITDDNDHADDRLHRQLLSGAAQLVEDYTGTFFGVRPVHELIEIKSTDRILLKHFPIQSVTAMTPTVQIVPRGPNNLVVESITGNSVSFHYRINNSTGLMTLTDSSGFELTYDGVLLSIDYLTGLAVVPKAVKTAALMLTSKLINMSTCEGVSSLRLSDLSFALDNKLFQGPIDELLRPYIHRSIR